MADQKDTKNINDLKAQYSYKANSNLVLPQERRRRGRAKDSGEVTALRVGQFDGKMGDRAGARAGEEKDPELTKRLEKTKKRREGQSAQVGVRSLADVVDTADQLQLSAGGVGYIPKSADSQRAYEELLAFIVEKLGDQPHEYLRDAAEETLTVLKTDNTSDKRAAIAELLDATIDDDDFSKLSACSRAIDDFGRDSVAVNSKDGKADDLMQIDGGGDDDAGVAVIIGDDDDDSESDPDEVRDLVDEDGNPIDSSVPVLRDADGLSGSDEDNEERPVGSTNSASGDTVTASGLRSEPSVGVASSISELDKNGDKEFDPLEVDGFWIQRQLKPFYSDAHECQKIAEQVLEKLAEPTHNASCENDLMYLFDFERIEFVKKVVQHRTAITYCTRRARAQTKEERVKIENEMRETEEGKELLAILKEGQPLLNGTSDGSAKVRKRRRRTQENANGNATRPLTEDKTKKKKRPKQKLRKLDLDDLVFTQGNHLLSTKKVSFNAEHLQYKDYEEWHIPATQAAMTADERPPLPISSLPTWAHSAFGKMTHLNRLQTAVQPKAFESDKNLLICAPTGAGKTNVALMTVLRALYNSNESVQSMHDFSLADADMSAFKVVYVAPMKALVSEVVTKMGDALKDYGIAVRELTGDVNLTRKQIEQTQVIVTTPEKWDVITRKSGERTFTSLVRLLIIDEIHLLHDDRGPVLEAIIARTMRNIENSSVVTRVVGLSATLPNYEDVGKLLRVDEGLFYFDSSYRPSPLQQCYVGITARKAVKRFKIMNDIMYEKVKSQVMASNQVIVFVHSRKETVTSGRLIVDRSIEDESIGHFMQHDSPSYNTIQAELGDVDSEVLKSLLIRGVGTHHAGMTRKDRLLVEGLFEARHIKVLVSTATLAWGVNLPAHAVIIKGTQVYSPEKGRWIELSPLDVMQMMGRAGRPQFDQYGEGFIITTSAEVQFYLSLLNHQLPIESHFISKLVDLLNAEIATGGVNNLEEGAKWLKYTYLYIRMVQNSALYLVPADERHADATLEKRRKELIHSAAIVLHKAKLIKYNRKTGEMESTDVGRIASDFYVGHKTMGIYAENMHPKMGDIDLFRLFSLSSEFKHMRVREEEKVEVKKLSEIVPIPIKDAIDSPPAKVNILLQAFIACLRLDGLVLKADMVYITQNAARLTRALLRLFIDKKWANVAECCLTLCKMVENRQWEVQTPLRQFRQILDASALRKIERKYIEFERYLNMSSSDMGELLRDHKLGKTVHRLVHSLPRIEIDVSVRPLTRSTLEFELILTPDFMFKSTLHGAGESFWIFVEDADAEKLLYSETFYLRRSVAKEKHTLLFTVHVTSPRPPHYFVKCFSDRWVVPETEVPVSFRNLILPEKFAPHTDYLALRPLPIDNALVLDLGDSMDEQSSLEPSGAFQSYFQSVLARDSLSPLLNQITPSLFKSDGNAIVATLPGQDRELAVCLAIGRLFILEPKSTAIWIVGGGVEEVELVRNYLEQGIGAALRLNIAVLKGEHSVDVATLNKEQSVIVTLPQYFDSLSRKWQGKKESRALTKVGLVLLDGIHLMSEEGEPGKIFEVVGSRLRYLSQQLWEEPEEACRIVAVSDPIANAKDVAEWLGVSKESLHSFLPSALPDCPQVEVWPCISRFGGGTLTSPAALSRRVLDAMKRHAPKGTESIVIFVPTRKLTRAMALEMVAVAPGQGGYLRVSENEVKPYLNRLKLDRLRQCSSAGVVFLHDGLTENDRNIGETLFKKGAARILVTTSMYAKRSKIVKGRLVIVAGTATEEAGGYSMQRAEYTKSDLTKMICCAEPSKRGTNGTCVVMTERALKDYYEEVCLKPTPLESQFPEVLTDQINAEVASGVIDTKESILHYLTWTFFFRRLPKNPNYYDLAGTSHMEKSSHLSILVDRSVSDLKDTKCVEVEGDDEASLSPLNLGRIGAHYYIRHATVEHFSAFISPKLKMRGLLDILSHATEFDDVPTRISDEEALERLSETMPVRIRQPDGDMPSLSSVHIKVHLLLQSHLSRLSMTGDLLTDRNIIVSRSVRLLRAMVDILSSAGWLEPTLICMELSQMLVQAVWSADKPLLQLPHFDDKLVEALAAHEVVGITDVYDMDPGTRKQVMSGLSKVQVGEISEALQTYPEINWNVAEPVFLGDEDNTVLVVVNLERDDEDVDEVPTVYASRFPQERLEGWWIVIGDSTTNTLLTVRHVTFKKKSNVKLRFTAPEREGKHDLTVSLVSDCYIDVDLEENVTIEVPASQGDADIDQQMQD